MRQISGEGNAAAQAECVLRRHGGGKPEGREGVSNSPVRGRRLVLHSPRTTHTLSKSPRDEQHIRSVLEPAVHFERACPVAFTLCPAMDVSNKTAALCGGFGVIKCVFGLLLSRECCLCRLGAYDGCAGRRERRGTWRDIGSWFSRGVCRVVTLLQGGVRRFRCHGEERRLRARGWRVRGGRLRQGCAPSQRGCPFGWS